MPYQFARTSSPWLATLVLMWLAVPAAAGKFNKVLDIGDKAPQWKGLIGVDDKLHALEDYRDKKAVVLIFTCNHCPVAQAYEKRLNAFAQEYAKKDVALVAVNVSNLESDRLPKMKERAEKAEYKFPYLYDASQEIGRKYGATCTPHAFVIDGKQRIAYMGKIDDSPLDESRAKEHFVRNAVDAVLKGDEPEVAETLQVGCGITYEAQ